MDICILDIYSNYQNRVQPQLPRHWFKNSSLTHEIPLLTLVFQTSSVGSFRNKRPF